MVRSRLTYSCQAWNITQHQKERIDATYNNMLRKMIRDGFREKNTREQNNDPDQEHNFSYILTNENVLNICKTENVNKYVSTQQAKYLAHLARQPNNTLTKRLLFNDNKNIKRGRPFVTLEQQVLNSMNMTADEFYQKELKINLKFDMVDPGRNRSTFATADMN